MSFTTQLIYRTLSTIQKECAKHLSDGGRSSCSGCPFDPCLNDTSPEGWDVDKLTDIVYDLGWRKGEKL